MSAQPTARDLVLLSLGPVQSFIETARRTQDLATASALLSWLARVAVEEGVQSGAEEVFPVRIDGRWPANIPNRVLVGAPAGEGAGIATRMARAAQATWDHTSGQLCDQFARFADLKECPQRWAEQTGEWLEAYWISWPWDGQPGTYGAAYEQASLALEARKKARHYPILAQPGEKCTLCGIRSALGTEDVLWKRVRHSAPVGLFRFSERLCAVCTCKRMAPRYINELKLQRFPSTSSVASASFRAALLYHWTDMEASVNTHLQKVEAMGFAPYAEVEHSGYWQTLATGDAQRRFLRFDGDYLYGTFFAKAQVEDALGSTLSVRTERALAEALDSWRALTRRAGEIGIGKPSTYYAVLALDGDEMSDLLSRSPSIDAHRDISEALMRFGAGPVQQMVEDDHPGKLIYSGGDDALALLPVDCALAVADKLAARFSAALVGAGAQGRTASIGIAVVHHLLPLDSALRAAREALQAAKEQYGRAALAIRVLRRSGEQRQVGACWHALHAAAPVDPIETVRTLMAEHKLSGKLAYDLSDEASALAAVPAAHALEIERLLKRHTDRGRWTESERDAQRHALAAELAALASALPILQGLSGIEQLGDWLLLARFLAQGERE